MDENKFDATKYKNDFPLNTNIKKANIISNAPKFIIRLGLYFFDK